MHVSSRHFHFTNGLDIISNTHRSHQVPEIDDAHNDSITILMKIIIEK